MFSRFEGMLVATRETDYSSTLSIEGTYTRSREAEADDGESVAAAVGTAVSMLLATLRDAVEEQSRASV
jgi:hypothetical protein